MTREAIMLNDLLQLSKDEIKRTKLRFMRESGGFDPRIMASDTIRQDKLNLNDLPHNAPKKINYRKDTIAVGFINIREDLWLMTGMVKVIKDNGYNAPADAEYLDKKYNYRVIVRFHKKSQNGNLNAKGLIDELEVVELWNSEKLYKDTSFPGYKNIKVGFQELKNMLQISDEWRTALKSRKGIYVITDTKAGKLYVGSAYGEKGILGRWEIYINSGYDKNELENGTYPNKQFRELVKKEGMSYIENNFQYSILETLTDDVLDKDIISRESFWKDVLMTRKYGYNSN